MKTTALHQMNPLERFSDRAGDYVKYRPSYPAGAIDSILQGLDRPVVADIGAGTGIASRLLADRGAWRLGRCWGYSLFGVAQRHR